MPDISREIRRFPKSEPGPEPLHVGIVYPNTYPVALASLGYQTVHRIAHSHPGILTHRITLESSRPGPHRARTLEESLAVKSLDALLVTCSFEPDYINLVRILSSAEIPPLRKMRKSPPLVIAGGVAVTGNPEPIAPVADAIAIGDAETMLPGLLDDLIANYPLLRGARFESGRHQLYEDWQARDGVYVPALWEDEKGAFVNADNRTVSQSSVANPDLYQSYTPIVSADGAYGAKNLVAISAGCHTRCRFCMLSFISPAGPVRSIRSVLENARIFPPSEASVGLISSRVSEHPDIVTIINSLADEGYNVSVSSLKVSSTTPEMLDALHRAGATGVTFAPEHGSERIRKLLGKPYTYDEVRDRLAWSFDSGLSNVKLYFLTGFEEETDDDLDSTSRFVLSLIEDIGLDSLPGNRRLGVSIAPFVPKAGTPFQRRAMDDERTLKRKLKRIIAPLKRRPRVDVETESPRESILQGLLSIGDRSLADYFLEVSKNNLPAHSAWDKAENLLGDSSRKMVLRSRPQGEWELPWGFISRPQIGEEDER
jgi:radical SAM superfamily enzyme YgiQ (UPF0313 family)